MEKPSHTRQHSLSSLCPHTKQILVTCPHCGKEMCGECFVTLYALTTRCYKCNELVSQAAFDAMLHDDQLRTLFLTSKRLSSSQFASSANVFSISSSVVSSDAYSESSYAAHPDNSLFGPVQSFTTETGTDGKIVQLATVEAMVGYMLSPENTDMYFLECFANSFPLVVTPERLLHLLCVRFDPPRTDAPWEEFQHAVLEPTRTKIVGFLRQWMNARPHDFTGDMLERLKWIVQRFAQYKTKTAQFLEKSIAALSVPSPLPEEPASVRLPRLPDEESFLGYHPHDWARQVTLIQMNLFRKIQMEEFLRQGWTAKDKETRAPNILKFVRFSNFLTDAIATAVVTTKDLHHRAVVLHYFITAAEHCRLINNFDGLKSILAGLEVSSVFRLKESWNRLPEQTAATFAELDHIIAADNNFQLLRNTMRLASPPMIPFLGSTLTDLIFVNENQDGDGVVNFFKVRNIGNLIKEIQIKQKSAFSFPIDYILNQIILDMPTLGEDALYEQSLALEDKYTPLQNPKDEKRRNEKARRDGADTFKAYAKALKKLVI